mmetsp:Transcript_6315/g.15632  ORF Transcript_6315/g.15632 Transcript_6315/m.15632 type:complete len:404 (-) Transcript_6315:3074-4285(-)
MSSYFVLLRRGEVASPTPAARYFFFTLQPLVRHFFRPEAVLQCSPCCGHHLAVSSAGNNSADPHPARREQGRDFRKNNFQAGRFPIVLGQIEELSVPHALLIFLQRRYGLFVAPRKKQTREVVEIGNAALRKERVQFAVELLHRLRQRHVPLQNLQHVREVVEAAENLGGVDVLSNAVPIIGERLNLRVERKHQAVDWYPGDFLREHESAGVEEFGEFFAVDADALALHGWVLKTPRLHQLPHRVHGVQLVVQVVLEVKPEGFVERINLVAVFVLAPADGEIQLDQIGTIHVAPERCVVVLEEAVHRDRGAQNQPGEEALDPDVGVEVQVFQLLEGVFHVVLIDVVHVGVLRMRVLRRDRAAPALLSWRGPSAAAGCLRGPGSRSTAAASRPCGGRTPRSSPA